MGSSQTLVKLTSKHQLTVPAAVVRQLHLKPGDSLNYRLVKGKIVLSPRPSMDEQLQKMWTENAKYIKRKASDESIKESARQYFRNQKQP